jgi:hypothetical protein
MRKKSYLNGKKDFLTHRMKSANETDSCLEFWLKGKLGLGDSRGRGGAG